MANMLISYNLVVDGGRVRKERLKDGGMNREGMNRKGIETERERSTEGKQ